MQKYRIAARIDTNVSQHFFVIGTDGRHHGPLSEVDVRTWLEDGRANRHSRARRSSEQTWAPLSQLPEFESVTRTPDFGFRQPTESTDDEPHAQIRRPEFASGRQAVLDPISCFRRAWWLITRDFALLGGWTLVVATAIIATGLIPRVGWLIGLVTNNLLMGGLYALYLGRIRGIYLSVADVVALLKKSAVTILLAGLAQMAMILAGLLLLVIPGVYLAVGYAFVLPLVLDRRLPVLEAMETSRQTVHRQWFPALGLLLAAGMLIFISARAYGLGLVLTLPLCTAALMFAYEDLFGEQQPGSSDSSPE